MLGRDRIVEKKGDAQTSQQRLQDAIQKHEGIKPRTLDWLIKLIDGIYKAKAGNDDQRAKAYQEALPLVDFVFQYLAGIYGTKDLVNQYAAQVHVTIEQFKREDPRVGTFQRFLSEQWGRKVLVVYIEGLRRLAEPARLPCCDFPMDYSTRKGGSTVSDVRKCLWVAEKVLMKRHAKTAYAFAAALAVRGEPITETELNTYFVAPGYYGADVATMKVYEKGRAEFRRIKSNVFLEALCEEYRRCEQIFSDVLPKLFQRWDQDQDGFMVQDDVLPMMEHMAAKDMTPEALQEAAKTFWGLMLKLDVDSSPPEHPPPGGGGGEAAAGAAGLGSSIAAHVQQLGGSSGMMGFRTFMEAALRSDVVRGYVRMYKTPPQKVRMDNSAEEQARLLLLVLVQRHWECHGAVLSAYVEGMGPLASKVQVQVEAMERERDGVRKALMLHTVLKALINRRLDRVVEQLQAQRDGAAVVDREFEASLELLTTSVKVLYGSPAILVNEVLNMDCWSSGSCVQREIYQRQLGQVMNLYNAVRGHMDKIATMFLGRSRDVQYFLQQWRARVATRRLAAAPATLVEEVAPQSPGLPQDGKGARLSSVLPLGGEEGRLSPGLPLDGEGARQSPELPLDRERLSTGMPLTMLPPIRGSGDGGEEYEE